MPGESGAFALTAETGGGKPHRLAALVTHDPSRHRLLSTVLGACCVITDSQVVPQRGLALSERVVAEKGRRTLGLHSEQGGHHRCSGASTNRHSRFLFSLGILLSTRASTAHPHQLELAFIKTLHFKLLGGGGGDDYLLFSFMSPIYTYE